MSLIILLCLAFNKHSDNVVMEHKFPFCLEVASVTLIVNCFIYKYRFDVLSLSVRVVWVISQSVSVVCLKLFLIDLIWSGQ